MGRIFDLKTNGTSISSRTIGRISSQQEEEKNRIAQEKEERIKQGLPVSVRKDRATPTGLGTIPRKVIGLGADVLANVRNAGRIAVGKEEKPVFKSKYLGDIKGLGKVDLTKSPFEKENLKVIIKSAATGAEIASYLNAAGVAKSTITGLTKQGVLASKATFAEWVVKMFPQLAKEGFGQGLAYTLGSQGREYADTGKPFSGKQALTDVATSTIGNVVIPSVLQKTFGAKTSKIMAARQAERAIKDAEILGKKIPDAGVQVKPITVEQPIAPKVDEVIADTIEPVTTPVKETPTIETPKIETPEIKEIPVETVTKDFESISNDIPTQTEDLTYGTFKDWSTQVRNLDIDEIINVAMGGKKTIQNNVPEGAYLSIAKNIADETGDIELAKKLAMSNVISKGAQTTVSAKIARSGNVSDMLRDVRTTFLKKKGITTEKFLQEEKVLVNSIKKKAKEISDDIINSLICK